jgi:A/G-specific adenine glycosylase
LNIVLTTEQIVLFRKKIYDFYQQNKRDFAWRDDHGHYSVLVSELMLQQTQTARVAIKFEQWMKRFPTLKSVADASTYEIAATWQGLGYNRRGLALQRAAKMIMDDFSGQLPQDLKLLQKLPGIGPNTAGSISAFAFNIPVVFIETNIRTVFLYEFFSGVSAVHDEQILSLVQQTVDQHDARSWYYALMDYGVYLKKELKATNKSSKHYTRQSKFVGSRREMRGAIVRVLTQHRQLGHEDLMILVHNEVPHNAHSADIVVRQLLHEGLIQERNHHYFL